MRLKNTEIFAIGCGKLFAKEEYDVSILYSPIKSEIALIDKDTLERFVLYLENRSMSVGEDIKDLYNSFYQKEISEVPVRDVLLSDHLSIIPNLTCNFVCTYCYSAHGRSAIVLEWDKAKSMLDFFIDKKRVSTRFLSLFISGGGEPLVSWPLTKKIIEYSNQRAANQGFDIKISIITNGSLITEDIAEVLRQNNCIAGVSFEVLEDLQNQQRKMWDAVSNNIKLLHNKGVPIKLNSTITPLSVSRMAEMVSAVVSEYPFVQAYTMEPVTSVELFNNAEELADFYANFFKSYVECSEIAKNSGTNLRFTFDDAMRGITVRHCPGKFCLTPTGKISVCHLVSSPKEDKFSECVYGEVTGTDGLNVDNKKFEALYNINVCHKEQCQDCFAKWDCGGECMTRGALYPANYMEEVCKFNRRFVKHILLKRLAESIMEDSGVSLEDYVNNN